MCNDFGNHIPYSAYLEAFSELRIPVRFPVASPNLEPREDIWPTDLAPVIRQTDHGNEFLQLRWGFPPARPKGPPVINLRSENRHFRSGRCLVPATHFFEFTGARSPKSKWKFTLAGSAQSDGLPTGSDWFCFAGVWRAALNADGDRFALLTTAPGPDVAPLHDRQVVVLERRDWHSWLDPSGPDANLLQALPAGRLAVQPVR